MTLHIARPHLLGADDALVACARYLLQHPHLIPPPIAMRSPLATRAGSLTPGCLAVDPPPRDFLLHAPPTLGRARCPFAPTGIAGVLSSEGGVGKTNLLLQLGISIITGRPWLGHYEVDPQRVGQRVLLLLAEETDAEVRRRVHAISKHLGLTLAERWLVEERLIALGLAGTRCALLRASRDGSVEATEHFTALLGRLQASNEPWALVGLDSLARLFPKAESDNELATAAITIIEQLTGVPGAPLALVLHHSSKTSRRTGSVDARGVTALTDNARLAITLRNLDDGTVELARTKGNYTPPMDKPLVLRRTPQGLLEVSTGVEKAAAADAAALEATKEREVLITRVVEVVAANPGLSSKNAICDLLKPVRRGDALAAIDLALQRKLVVNAGTEKQKSFVVPPEEGWGAPPTPPGGSGNRSGGGGSVPGNSTGTAGNREPEAGNGGMDR